MKKAGDLYIPDRDTFFGPIFEESGDKFDEGSLLTALGIVSASIGSDLENYSAIEVGAHVGSWTRILSRHFARVSVFEPIAENAACLIENTKGLGNVAIYLDALGVCNGKRKMAIGQNRHNSGTWHFDDDGGYLVTVSTLDDHFKSTTKQPCAFLKIDVEGFEEDVLLGGLEMIEREKPVILLEMNELAERYGQSNERTIQVLEDLNYSVRARVNKDYVYDHESRFDAGF